MLKSCVCKNCGEEHEIDEETVKTLDDVDLTKDPIEFACCLRGSFKALCGRFSMAEKPRYRRGSAEDFIALFEPQKKKEN